MAKLPPKPPPLYSLPGRHPGLLAPGNIDINRRAKLRVPNPAGGFSSVYSMSFPVKGKGEVLIPLVVHRQGRWQVVSPRMGMRFYRKTGKNLGVFANAALATRYAIALHLQQAAAGG